MGFDDIELASFVEPRLTTMHVKRKEMGAQAVDLLLKLCAGKKLPVFRCWNPNTSAVTLWPGRLPRVKRPCEFVRFLRIVFLFLSIAKEKK